MTTLATLLLSVTIFTPSHPEMPCPQRAQLALEHGHNLAEIARICTGPYFEPEPPVPTTVPTSPTTTFPSTNVMGNMSSDVTRWRPLASEFWSGTDLDIVLCLIKWESGGNPDAYNSSSGASGLLQVLSSWADDFGVSPSDLFNPVVNLTIGYELSKMGWASQWSAYRYWNGGSCA